MLDEHVAAELPGLLQHEQAVDGHRRGRAAAPAGGGGTAASAPAPAAGVQPGRLPDVTASRRAVPVPVRLRPRQPPQRQALQAGHGAARRQRRGLGHGLRRRPL